MSARKPSARTALAASTVADLLGQIDTIDGRGGSGRLELPDGQRLDVTNLGKVFWPALKLTKGDLFRHYVRVAPFLLPALADRPLVMKRYPNGVAAQPFYQHRAPEAPPAGVRIEVVATGTERRPHVIGGGLLTLLYTSQLASISQDPWFSRVGSETDIDHAAIDLDPPDGLPFARVLDVARWVRDELAAMKAPAFAKTSGSRGLHIYVPMRPARPTRRGSSSARSSPIASRRSIPTLATTERSIGARGRRIYLDYMQNVRGKTLASVYSVRANEFAGVSTPLTWDEVDAEVDPRDFTLPTCAARLETAGDLWADLRRSKGANLRFSETPPAPRGRGRAVAK